MAWTHRGGSRESRPAVSTNTESQVAAAVMAHLISDGWECWPEVVLPEGRADIVAVRPFPFMPHRRCVHIVETKVTWSVALLEQAVSRCQYAHFSSIAAPGRVSTFYARLCRDFGVGVLPVFRRSDGSGGFEYDVDSYLLDRQLAPRLNRHRRGDRYFGPHRTLAALCEDQKRYAPGGTASSGYSTPWRRTMDAAVRFVAAHPGATVKELVAGISHHYASSASARQGLLVWLEKRVEVEARREGRVIRFYPAGTNAPATQPELVV
jgi:hypothetical protein